MELWTDEKKDLVRQNCEYWEGTPHRNRVAVHGVGIDCLRFHFSNWVASTNIPAFKFPYYKTMDGMFNESNLMRDIMLQAFHVEQIDKYEPQFGDAVVFRTGSESAHIGTFVDDRLWHSLAGQRVQWCFYNNWLKKIDCLIRLTQPGAKIDPKEVKLYRK